MLIFFVSFFLNCFRSFVEISHFLTGNNLCSFVFATVFVFRFN